MVSATVDQLRDPSALFGVLRKEPVEILDINKRREAVLVSPSFYDRALDALEYLEDVRDAVSARKEPGLISHEQLMASLGI